MKKTVRKEDIAQNCPKIVVRKSVRPVSLRPKKSIAAAGISVTAPKWRKLLLRRVIKSN